MKKFTIMVLALVLMAGTTFAQMQRKDALKPLSKTELQKKGANDMLTFHAFNLTTQQETSASFPMSTVKNFMAAHEDSLIIQWSENLAVTAGDQYIVYYDIDYAVADTFVVWNTYASANDGDVAKTALIWYQGDENPYTFAEEGDNFGVAFVMTTKLADADLTQFVSTDENWSTNYALDLGVYLDRMKDWYDEGTNEYMFGKNSMNITAAGELFTAGATGVIYATEMIAHYATKAGGGEQGTANLFTALLNETGDQLVSATSYNFGNVNVGQSGNVAVYVANNGTATGTITAASLANTDGIFSVQGTIGDLAPNDYMDFAVTFRPTAAGQKTNTLVFTTSTGTLNFSLIGTGVSEGPDAITNAKAANIAIYPNPAKDMLTIANAENAQISIYNLVGQEVRKIERAATTEVINVADLAKGSYIVKIMNEGNVATQKFNVVR